MRKSIKQAIQSNLSKNAGKRRILTSVDPYKILKEKFANAKIAKSTDERKIKDDFTTKVRKLRSHSTQIEPLIHSINDKVEQAGLNAKLPYRLRMALEEMEQFESYERSDFGRLMKGK